MRWQSRDYTIRVTVFVSKDNPLPVNYDPEELWKPLWSEAEIEAFSERLNAKWRQVRVAEVFDTIFDLFDMDIMGYVEAMSLKGENPNLEKSTCYRYYTDPTGKRHAVRIRVEMLPVQI